ncbi:MAG TPA: elongation factor G-binding protein, partial [Bacillaceae bacterium]
APVGMFMTETKGQAAGTFVKRGNTICQDSQVCNENLTSLDKLEAFIELLK